VQIGVVFVVLLRRFQKKLQFHPACLPAYLFFHFISIHFEWRMKKVYTKKDKTQPA